MVRLDKTGISVPPILQPGNKGEVATQQLLADHESGVRVFEFDSKIYGHESVKSALIVFQNGKCCCCESFLRHVSPGDVEHFRPKAGFQILPDTPLVKPGYYWLAYDFSNLFLSCEICNRVFKKNYFPLVDESKRVRSHHQHTNLQEENSLIIHPSEDEPSEHIEFDREIPKGKDEKGSATIKRVGLDRFDLNEERLRFYEIMAFIADKARTGDNEALKIIRKAAHPKERYSLMIRCNFSDLL